jgi:hypothetical protein
MDVMNKDAEKNKGEENNPDEIKKQISPDQKGDKETTLAKRSGQRPALLFKRPQRGRKL